MPDKSGASPQAVSLPSGGGDIRGLGENFQPDLNTGTGTYRFPFDLPPGVRRFQPIVGLVYHTAGGNGPWGLGWTVPIPSIARRTFRGVPTYDDARDTFLYNGSELAETAPQTYRTLLEYGFEQISRAGEAWVVTERSGIRHWFGESAEGRVEFDADGETKVLAWLLQRSEDTAGNTILYRYRQEGNQRYLSEVRYAIYSLRFEYEPREDVVLDCRGGFELPTTLRCSRVTLHADPVGPAAIRTWELDYQPAPLSELSILSRVTLSGFNPESGQTASLPPLQLSYASFNPTLRSLQRFQSEVGAPPPGFDTANAELIDLEGRGLPGVLSMAGGSPRYWPNHGRLRWGPPGTLSQFPSALRLAEARVRLADMDGNGGADLLVANRPMSGYFENNGSGQWERFVPYRQTPALDFESGELQLIDVNGDGLIDAVRTARTGLHVFENRGRAGWKPPRLVANRDPATVPPNISSGDPRVHLADVNGDGMLDVVLISSGRCEYWPSLGGGRFGPSRVVMSSPRFPYPFDPARVFVTDVNGDGLADVVFVGYDEVTYWVNQSGNRFSAPQILRHTPPTSRIDTMRVADMNATGTAGLLWTTPYTDYRYLDFTGGVKPGLLTGADNGLGRRFTIEYSTSTEQAALDRENGRNWESFLPIPVQVVAAVITEDSISGLRSVTRYRYHDGHYDGERREFDGFASAEQIEEGDTSMPTMLTIFHHHTEASTRQLVPNADQRRALKRKLYRVEVYGVDGAPEQGRPYRVEETLWDVRVEIDLVDGRRVLFPFTTETSVSTFEREATALRERKLFQFDANGNVIREERRMEGGGGESQALITVVDYASNPAAGITDAVARMVQRDEAGNLLAETRHYYDGPAFQGLPLGQVDRGFLSRSEKVVFRQADAVAIYGANTPDFVALGYHAGVDVDGQAAWLVDDESFEVSAAGNVLARRDGLGNTTSYGFDAFGLFVTSMSDSLGLAGTIEFDYRAGKARRLTNPNGVSTNARYDPLGRIAAIIVPPETVTLPTIRYTYDTANLPARRTSEYRVTSELPQMVRIFEYLDGGGSVFQRRTEYDGNIFMVSGKTILNARAKPAQKGEPFFAAGVDFQPYIEDPAVPVRQFTWDALGRPVSTRNPDGGECRAIQENGQALFYDPNDTDPGSNAFETPRIEEYDPWQRLIGVHESDGAATQTTRYSLDPQGRLVEVRDARDLVLNRITYDMTGRRVALEHLDGGRRLLVYDAAGNTVATFDAAGAAVTYTYDAGNRVATCTYGGNVAEQYFYDAGAGANLAGRLARVVDPSGETAFSYDERGRVTERTITPSGQANVFRFRYEYDRLGRVTRLTYPDNSVATTEFYSGLLPRRMPGLVDSVDYAPSGVRTVMQYANGVRTEYRYDSTTTRLSEIETSRPATSDVYYQCRYAIDRAGNVDGITDMRAIAADVSRTQLFEYDPLYRLTGANGADNAGAYVHTYEYDAVGNFTRNPLIATGQPLRYAAGGASNRLVGFNDGGNDITLFDYDANGNTVLLPGRTLTFDPKQQLERVQLADGTDVRLFYDYRGVLARKQVVSPAGNSDVLYFDNLYEVENGTATRFLYLDQVPVGRVSGGTMVFQHNDHTGTTVVFTDAAGSQISEAAYYPFGAVARMPAAVEVPEFTGKRFDAQIGLYYFNARWYAPDLGRFLSVDPLYLFHPERGVQDPKRLNPYAYAGNNPVRFIDPSGLGFWDVVLGIGIAIAAVIAAPVVIGIAVAGIGATIAAVGTALVFGTGVGMLGATIGAIVGGAIHGTWEGALRGALIGFTAGVNFAVGSLIFGPLMGAALGVITFLSIIPAVAQSDVYQGILGWSSYFMPMSWPGHILGLTLFSLNVAGFLITFGQVDTFRIRALAVDWKTGNIFTVGGWVGGIQDRAFNFGAFSFVNTSRFIGGEIAPATFEHESGHMLSNAAFGFFQATRVFEGDSEDSFWEKIAESNVPPGLRLTDPDPTQREPDRSRIPVWGP